MTMGALDTALTLNSQLWKSGTSPILSAPRLLLSDFGVDAIFIVLKAGRSVPKLGNCTVWL